MKFMGEPMFKKAIMIITALSFSVLNTVVFAEETQELSLEEQISAFEQNREEVNQQIEVVDALHKDVQSQNKNFVKEANKALSDERKQIRDHIKMIDALLKDRPLPSADKCDPDDPSCADFCRAHKGVCYKGHCCS